MRSTLKHRIPITMLLVLLFLPACDSNEEETLTDVQMLVGTWAIIGFFDDTGDRSDIIAQGFEGIHLEFADTGTGALEVFAKQGPARLLSTSYTVDSDLDFITMTVDTSIDAALSLDLAYTFTLEDQRANFHTTHTDALNTIFGSDLTGDVRVVASKFGEDGVVE